MLISTLLEKDRQWLTHAYLNGFLLSLIAYGIWIQYSPKMGGIFIRPGPDNRKHFNLMGIIPMLKYPFQSLHFWKPDFWDLNFIIFTQTVTAAFMLVKAYKDAPRLEY